MECTLRVHRKNIYTCFPLLPIMCMCNKCVCCVIDSASIHLLVWFYCITRWGVCVFIFEKSWEFALCLTPVDAKSGFNRITGESRSSWLLCHMLILFCLIVGIAAILSSKCVLYDGWQCTLRGWGVASAGFHEWFWRWLQVGHWRC